MCTNVRVLGIESFLRYFLYIVGIIRFCDFMFFPSRRNMLIFQSCTAVLEIVERLSLIHGCRHN